MVVTADDGQRIKLPIQEVIYYDNELKDGERPNFDVVMVKTGELPPSVRGPIPGVVTGEGEQFVAGSLRALILSDDGKIQDMPVELVASLDSSRLFHLLQVGLTDRSMDAHERNILKKSMIYRTKDGVWTPLATLAKAPATLFDGQRGLFYTDLRRYRDFIENTVAGKPPLKVDLPPRGALVSFADWYAYPNYRDEGWVTVQQLLWGLAAKVGTYPLRLFTDCRYASDMVLVHAKKELRFTGNREAPFHRPLSTLVPLAGLGEIRSLAVYFEDFVELDVPKGLKVARLDIVAAKLNESGLCALVDRADVKSLGLWEIRNPAVDLACLLKCSSLKEMDLAYSKLKNTALIEPLKRQMDLRYSP